MTTLRPITAADLSDARLMADLVRVFRSAREGLLQFTLDLHTAEDDAAYFFRVILPRDELWLAEVDGVPAGFISFSGGWVQQLQVAPEFQNRGVGSRLLDLARRSAPSLQLWVFQVNAPAIRFYERRGFTVVERTDGAGNEEKQPDTRMTWTAPSDVPNRVDTRCASDAPSAPVTATEPPGNGGERPASGAAQRRSAGGANR